MVKVTQKRDECIGCGACAAVAPELWNMEGDGKATLKGGKKNGSMFELDISSSLVAKAKESAEVCPVTIIAVK